MENQSAKVTTQNYPLTIKSGQEFLHSSGPAFLFGGVEEIMTDIITCYIVCLCLRQILGWWV